MLRENEVQVVPGWFLWTDGQAWKCSFYLWLFHSNTGIPAVLFCFAIILGQDDGDRLELLIVNLDVAISSTRLLVSTVISMSTLTSFGTVPSLFASTTTLVVSQDGFGITTIIAQAQAMVDIASCFARFDSSVKRCKRDQICVSQSASTWATVMFSTFL